MEPPTIVYKVTEDHRLFLRHSRPYLGYNLEKIQKYVIVAQYPSL